MKTPTKLLPLILFGIAVTSLFSVQPAQGFTITLEQMGSNVVANGSGAINFTGLTFGGSGPNGGSLNPVHADIRTGPSGPVTTDSYFGVIAGPTNFGSGGLTSASSGSGDLVGINFFNVRIFVPQGYGSGTLLSGSSTYVGATFASLGVTPGTYVWTWGTGLPNQNFTLIIGGAGVPDGGTTVSLLGCALLGLAALRRKLSC